ncbi:hypothetical protein KL86APRO_11923 [uncultured Alphaproteobacteria bacterium]|uniref:Antitoxin-like ribbon-helix-helix domain-containing protein n=1 Tax=uncultured Alphaproteobacteria bacterium TaxID=91750 RepID=A0A212JZZ0_9PROT|nr:hypothetical protein KL86APRO_11923 [uncultured Alphaproteobacteria bacterium]
MAVTFTRSHREPTHVPPKSLKLKRAIPHARQCTVKVTPDTKLKLKMLAAKRNTTMMSLLSEALTSLIAEKPASIPGFPKPEPFEKIGFKIDPALFQSLQELAAKTQSNVQSLVSKAILSITKSNP